MSKHFGSSRYIQTNYNKKLLVIGGSFISVMTALTVTVVLISFSSDEGSPENTLVPEAGARNINSVEIIESNQRIEEGSQITREMLTSRSISIANNTPPSGIILAGKEHEIIGKYAKVQIRPNMPLIAEDIVANRPISRLPIPEGMRAVAITVNSTDVISGVAMPDNRVDVFWRYKDKSDGQHKVLSIVQFVRILSVNGFSYSDAEQQEALRKSVGASPVPVTLLVEERDAKKIELARAEGQLTLALNGSQAYGKPIREQEVIDYTTLTGSKSEAPEERKDGSFSVINSKTGEQEVFELVNGKWRRQVAP